MKQCLKRLKAAGAALARSEQRCCGRLWRLPRLLLPLLLLPLLLLPLLLLLMMMMMLY